MTGADVAGLLLAHGAGGNRDHRLFMAIEAALDLPVRRLDFAYRRKGPRQPPAPAARLVTELAAEATAWADELGVTPDRLVLGGRSLGGRVCSMAVAEGLGAAGLILLSYPLHPPGKPERLRIEHFPAITVPSLFVSGDRDPFGTPEEFMAHLASVGGSTELVVLEREGHDPKKHDDAVIDAVTRFIDELGRPRG